MLWIGGTASFLKSGVIDRARAVCPEERDDPPRRLEVHAPNGCVLACCIAAALRIRRRPRGSAPGGQAPPPRDDGEARAGDPRVPIPGARRLGHLRLPGVGGRSHPGLPRRFELPRLPGADRRRAAPEGRQRRLPGRDEREPGQRDRPEQQLREHPGRPDGRVSQGVPAPRPLHGHAARLRAALPAHAQERQARVADDRRQRLLRLHRDDDGRVRERQRAPGADLERHPQRQADPRHDPPQGPLHGSDRDPQLLLARLLIAGDQRVPRCCSTRSRTRRRSRTTS